jgi:hypothetical protein
MNATTSNRLAVCGVFHSLIFSYKKLFVFDANALYKGEDPIVEGHSLSVIESSVSMMLSFLLPGLNARAFLRPERWLTK